MSKIQYLVLCPMAIEFPYFEKPDGSIFIAYNTKEEAEKYSEGGKFPIYEIEKFMKLKNQDD